MKQRPPVITRYTLPCKKLAAPVRIAMVADLHNSRYGAEQARLIEAVQAAAPDLAVFCGDTFHRAPEESNALTALTALSPLVPCYFISGNHEQHYGRLTEILQEVDRRGVTVLDGACVRLSLRGQTVQLCGLAHFPDGDAARMDAQLARLSAQLEPEQFSVLLAHRPERFERYFPMGFDAVLSGHTHGGQWRLPFAKNGLLAPNQGWFPKFAGGAYAFGEKTLVVSRGLSKKPRWACRIGNPPELTIVEFVPSVQAIR